MDKRLEEYMQSLVSQVLTSPNFVNLSEDQKQQYAAQIRDHFHNVIFDNLLNNLTSEQLNTLKNLGLSSPRAAVKIEEFSAEIPNFAAILENALQKEVESIKNNPQAILQNS